MSLRRIPAARRSFGITTRTSPGVRRTVKLSRTSSTTPYCSSNVTQSPMRSGCVIASMIPATTLASVWRAAKPMMAAASAPEASTLFARFESPVNCDSATAMPISRIDA